MVELDPGIQVALESGDKDDSHQVTTSSALQLLRVFVLVEKEVGLRDEC